MSHNETEGRKRLNPLVWITSVFPLAVALIGTILNIITKWLPDAVVAQIAVGLMSAGLIAYIIAELGRERSYEKNTLEILNNLTDLRASMSPFRVVSPEERYQLGTHIASAAKERVVLVAPSLILLTGPRPYFGEELIPHEKKQSEVFNALVQRASAKVAPRFRCAYAAANVMQVIKENNQEKDNKLRDHVIKNLEGLVAKGKQPGSLFELRRFQDLRENMNYVFIVGDDTFAIWIRNAVNRGNDICITGKDRKIADNLVYLFNELTNSVDTNQEVKLLRTVSNTPLGSEATL